MAPKIGIEIIGYQPKYAYYFEKYNREWIEESYTLEEMDLLQLQYPEKSIIKEGGEIFFAKFNNEIIGTVALKKKNNDEYELSKLAVNKNGRGIGAGKLLCETIIERAKQLGAKKVILYSNPRQHIAIKLYRKLGFIEAPLETVTWERANIKMELTLSGIPDMVEIRMLLESFCNAYNKLITCLEAIPKEIWNWQPPYKKWTIHQNIIHLADSEAHTYTRFRSFIAEPGSSIISYNQDLWAESLFYESQNTTDALEAYRLLREMTYNLLKQIPETCWEHTIEHSEYGTIKMWQWLRHAESHTHIYQIQRVYNEWIKQSKIKIDNAI